MKIIVAKNIATANLKVKDLKSFVASFIDKVEEVTAEEAFEQLLFVIKPKTPLSVLDSKQIDTNDFTKDIVTLDFNSSQYIEVVSKKDTLVSIAFTNFEPINILTLCKAGRADPDILEMLSDIIKEYDDYINDM